MQASAAHRLYTQVVPILALGAILLHGATGSWDEIALLGVSVVLGVATAMLLGKKK